MKRTKLLTASVVLTMKRAKDFGLGRGVLHQREILFTAHGVHKFNSSMFAMALLKAEADILRDVVRVEWKEGGLDGNKKSSQRKAAVGLASRSRKKA